MAKIKVIENFTGGGRNTTYLNVADGAIALSLCQTLYGGNLEVHEESTGITVSEPDLLSKSCKLMQVALNNDTSDKSTFIQMYVKDTVSSLDVINGLVGKTINGVKAERVTIVKSVKYTV